MTVQNQDAREQTPVLLILRRLIERGIYTGFYQGSCDLAKIL